MEFSENIRNGTLFKELYCDNIEYNSNRFNWLSSKYNELFGSEPATC